MMVLYNSACLDITSEHTPDPWIATANGKFYLTFTGNNRVPMWDGETLMDLHDKPNRGPVFPAQTHGPLSERLWAPELHCLRGRWYIYFAGADKQIGNRTHRTYVLGGPSEDGGPHAGPWELLGPVQGMDQRQWSIDSTVFEIDGTLYLCYSGWPRREENQSGWEECDERIQQLFIYRLQDPITVDSGPVMISHPSEPWERLGEYPAINEGPQWLVSPSGHWRGLVFSCSASWTKHYKMATLKYCGGDPLKPNSWLKSTKPLLQNRLDGLGPYGQRYGWKPEQTVSDAASEVEF
jgi:GH43 family beta-xylosidase